MMNLNLLMMPEILKTMQNSPNLWYHSRNFINILSDLIGQELAHDFFIVISEKLC